MVTQAPIEQRPAEAENPSRFGHYFRSLPAIYSDVFENRQFNAVYFMMLVMSCLIALLGLLVNSPAVIIGAMLISPLMGPILACGLALTLADWKLGKKSLRNVALSVVEAIAIATLAASLSPLQEATTEILARSNPNLMDLLIAFFSGVAGTLALTSRAKGGLTIIPGVAIATAVMPPLATTGFGIATGQWEIARGAFMLFFTNLTAIVISADLVFLFVGFRPQAESVGRYSRFLRVKLLVAVLIMSVLSIPLIQTLSVAAQQAGARRQILAALQTLEEPGRTRISGWEFRLGDPVSVDVSIATTARVLPERLAELESYLAGRLGRAVNLRVQQIRVEDPEAVVQEQTRARTDDFVSGGAVLGTGTRDLATPGVTLANLQGRLEASLESLLEPMGVDSVRIEGIAIQQGGLINMQLRAREPQPTEVAAWQVAAAALAREYNAPMQLNASVLITDEAEPLIVTFRPNSETLTAAELRRIRSLLEGLAGRTDLQLAFSPSVASEPSITAKRLRYLSGQFPEQVSSTLSFAEQLKPDEMQVRLRQNIVAIGETARAPSPLPQVWAEPQRPRVP